MIMRIIGIVCILLFVVGAGFAICYSPVGLGMRAEYNTQMSVDKPDQIENAISNVVFDLEKRDFVPVNLDVKWHPISKTYIIFASGIDRTHLGKYEP